VVIKYKQQSILKKKKKAYFVMLESTTKLEPITMCILLACSNTGCFLVMQVKQFYTAPTLIRSLMAAGDHWVTEHDRSSLRVLGTVGEPINPEAWRWYHEVRSRWHRLHKLRGKGAQGVWRPIVMSFDAVATFLG
jgi:hypothetical protein